MKRPAHSTHAPDGLVPWLLVVSVWAMIAMGRTSVDVVGATAPRTQTQGRHASGNGATAIVPQSGLEVELRLWHARISIPWLQSLPLTPGRRIIVTVPADRITAAGAPVPSPGAR